MTNILHLFLFKILQLIYSVWSATESLINGFIRYFYIPVFHPNLDHSKIIDDLASLDKKPCDELTFVYEVRTIKGNDLKRTALRIVRNAKIVVQSINPSSLNCYLDTSFLDPQETMEIKSLIGSLLEEQSLRLNVFLQEDFDYGQQISAQKKKITPLVIVYSTYPSVLGIHPSFLVGSEIAFRPAPLKATDYDLYSSLQGYAASQQRKGK